MISYVSKEKLEEVFPKGAVNSGKVCYEFHSFIYTYFGRCSFFKKFSDEKVNPVRDKYVIFILGKGGPTGKSTLEKALRQLGYQAFDISEAINDVIEYKIKENKFNRILVNELEHNIVVFLNEILER